MDPTNWGSDNSEVSADDDDNSQSHTDGIQIDEFDGMMDAAEIANSDSSDEDGMEIDDNPDRNQGENLVMYDVEEADDNSSLGEVNRDQNQPTKLDKKQRGKYESSNVLNEFGEDGSSVMDDSDNPDNENSFITDEFLHPIRDFFLKKLVSFIVDDCKGNVNQLKGWNVQILRRGIGINSGTIDVIYYNSKGKRYRGRVEVAMVLGVTNFARNFSTMSRIQLFDLAKEYRQRQLLSYLLLTLEENSIFTAVQELDDGDNLTLITIPSDKQERIPGTSSGNNNDIKSNNNHEDNNNDEKKQQKQQQNSDNNNASHVYFGYGNTAVLNWGQINKLTGFHTVNQLFPIGFRCIRQEYDRISDCVVECLCEILVPPYARTSDRDGKEGTGAGIVPTQTPPPSGVQQFPPTPKIPLFRVTVGWEMPDGKIITKVYEGSTPKQVWLAVQGETLGDAEYAQELIDVHRGQRGEEVSTAVVVTDKECQGEGAVAGEEDNEESTDFEAPDDEEVSIRREILEIRKRVIREQQAEKQQLKGAAKRSYMKERLALGLTVNIQGGQAVSISKEEQDSALEMFIDPGLHRLIEGMQGAADCVRYIFSDCRLGEGNGTKEGGRKLLSRSLTMMHDKMRLLEKLQYRQIADMKMYPMKDDKRNRRLIAMEARKRAKQDMKDFRVVRQQMINQRKQRLKDLEKNIKTLRDSILRENTRRRQEARARTELECEKEMMAEQRQLKKLVLSTNIAEDLKLKRRMTFPDIKCTSVGLPGDCFGKLLELWGVLTTFSPVLGIVEVPSLSRIVNALRTLDPILKYTTGRQPASHTIAEHRQLLNDLGQAFCPPLEQEFKKVMGMDIAEAYLGPCRVPVNALTWREVARIVLVSSYCRERLGWTDLDISGNIRGRGHTTAPDGLDRRSLKILRRRFIYRHFALEKGLSHDSIDPYQDPYTLTPRPIVGFHSGRCIRVQAPRTSPNRRHHSWYVILKCILDLSEDQIWRTKELVEAAIVAAEEYDLELNSTTKISQVLKDSLSGGRQQESVSHYQIEAKRLLLEYSDTPVLEDSFESSSEAVTALPDLSNKNGVTSTEIKNEGDSNADSSLSFAMQRCYQVIRDLMTHALAAQFILPIDAPAPPIATATQLATGLSPISTASGLGIGLLDISQGLLEGLYGNSITAFYRDVIGVCTDPVSFSPEVSPQGQNGIKLAHVFDRLMMEYVFCEEQNILPTYSYCHGCRKEDGKFEEQKKGVLCDRCDAPFHLDCARPQLQVAPRGEWYCQYCIMQRSPLDTHPCRSLAVKHPEYGCIGSVVQLRRRPRSDLKEYNKSPAIQYVVEFVLEKHINHEIPSTADLASAMGSEQSSVRIQKSLIREVWTGDKARRFAAETLPTLPSGFSFVDLDKICGLSLGYEGWGWTWSGFTPWVRSDENPLDLHLGLGGSAIQKRRDEDISRVLQLLETDLVSIEDWIDVLHSIAWKSVSSPVMLETVSKLDEECSTLNLPQIRSKNASHGYAGLMSDHQLETFAKNLKVTVGDSVVFAAFEDIEENNTVDESRDDSRPQRKKKTMDVDVSGSVSDDFGTDAGEEPVNIRAKLTPAMEDVVKDKVKSYDDILDELDFEDALEYQDDDNNDDNQDNNNSNIDKVEDLQDNNNMETGDTDDCTTVSYDLNELEVEDDLEDISILDPNDEWEIHLNGSKKNQPDQNNSGLNATGTITEIQFFDDVSTDTCSIDEELSVALSFDPPSDDEVDFNMAPKEDGRKRGVRTPSILDTIQEIKTPAAQQLYEEKLKSSLSVKLQLPVELEFVGKSDVIEDMKPPKLTLAQTKRLSDATEWELLRRSRRQGREDAILTKVMLEEANENLNIDEGFNDDVYQFNFSSNTTPATAFHMLLKYCTPKPPDDCDPIEWFRAWQQKLEDSKASSKSLSVTIKSPASPKTPRSLSQTSSDGGVDGIVEGKEMEVESSGVSRSVSTAQDTQNQSDAAVSVCEVCGFSEDYVLSPLVWGQSLIEWKAGRLTQKNKAGHFLERKISTTSTTTSLDELDDGIVDSYETIESDNNNGLNKGNAAASSVSDITDRMWMMYDCKGKSPMEIVQLCGTRHYHVGSLVVHECCADQMTKFRLTYQTRVQQIGEQHVYDTMIGISKGKIFPLGKDSLGNFYWIFPGSTSLYISLGRVEKSEELLSESLEELVIRWMRRDGHNVLDLVDNSDDSNPDLLEDHKELKYFDDNCRWLVFSNIQEIKRIVDWLDVTIVCEKIIRDILVRLFPAVTELTATEDVSDVTKKQMAATLDLEEDVMFEVEEGVAADSEIRKDLSDLSDNQQSLCTGIQGDGSNIVDSHSSNHIISRKADKLENSSAPRDSRMRYKNLDGDDDGTLSDLEFDECLQPPTARPATLSMNSSVTSFLVGETALLLDDDEDVLDEIQDVEGRNFLWTVRILRKKTITSSKRSSYKRSKYYVTYEGWSEKYNSWVNEEYLYSMDMYNVIQQELAKRRYHRKNTFKPPKELQSLQASKFYTRPWRHRVVEEGAPIIPINFSMTTASDPLELLKVSLFMMEAAMPLGAMEESDDRWSRDFSIAWRAAVVAAEDATALMECQVLLEYGVRTSWLHPYGAKLLTCMPSRINSLRYATYGLVAMRIWALDQAVRFDKIQHAGEPEGKSGNKKVNSSSKTSGKRKR